MSALDVNAPFRGSSNHIVGMSGHGKKMVAGQDRAMIRFAPANSSYKDTINRDERAHPTPNGG